MAIYFFLLFLNVIFCLVGYNNKTFDKFGGFLIALFMCGLCCLRDLYCGTDTINYHRIFFYNPEMSDQRLEPLFLGVRNSFSNFQLFLSFFAVGTYAIIYYICAKEVRYTSLALLIFMITPTKFFPESFNIIRQSLASALILWGFMEWNNKKLVNTLVLFTIATLFHYSSFIAIFFMLVPRQKIIGFKWATILVGTTCLLGITGITSLFVQTFVVGLGEADIHPLITTYARYGLRINHTMQVSSLVLWLIPLTVFTIVCYPFSEKAKEHYRYYYSVFLIGTIIGNLFIPPMDSGIRFVFSIMITQILVVPAALKYAGNQQKAFIAASILLCTASYIFYIYHLQFFYETSIVPYKSIL